MRRGRAAPTFRTGPPSCSSNQSIRTGVFACILIFLRYVIVWTPARFGANKNSLSNFLSKKNANSCSGCARTICRKASQVNHPIPSSLFLIKKRVLQAMSISAKIKFDVACFFVNENLFEIFLSAWRLVFLRFNFSSLH